MEWYQINNDLFLLENN